MSIVARACYQYLKGMPTQLDEDLELLAALEEDDLLELAIHWRVSQKR